MRKLSSLIAMITVVFILCGCQTGPLGSLSIPVSEISGQDHYYAQYEVTEAVLKAITDEEFNTLIYETLPGQPDAEWLSIIITDTGMTIKYTALDKNNGLLEYGKTYGDGLVRSPLTIKIKESFSFSAFIEDPDEYIRVVAAGNQGSSTDNKDENPIKDDTSYETRIEDAKERYAEIYSAYEENELRAEDTYEGRRFVIYAKINGMETGGLLNLTGGATLTMEYQVGNTIVFFLAEFEKEQEGLLKDVNVGDYVYFEGACHGGNWDDCELIVP